MLPIKIENCPIVDSVVELRFEPKVYRGAIFGILYNAFKSEYQDAKKLPLLQMPSQLLETDPNFKFKPHYSISNGLFKILIGPDVIAFNGPKEYIGWEKYSSVVNELISRIIALDFINIVTRVGIRYVNFFELDIFESIKINLEISNTSIRFKNATIRTELDGNFGFVNRLQIANNSSYKKGSENIKGSIIDIDTFKKYERNEFLEDHKTELNSGHDNEKKLFFSLIKDDFLQTLKPIYQ